MPCFDVYVYAIARLKVPGIEADSPQGAVQKAEQMIDLHQAIALGEAEYADEIEGFLVDAFNDAGERMEAQSVFFDAKEYDPKMKHSSLLWKLAQLGRSCLRFLWALGQKLKPRGRA